MIDDRKLVKAFLKIYDEAETNEDRANILARGEALLHRKVTRQSGIPFSVCPDNHDDIIARHDPIYRELETLLDSIKIRGQTSNIVSLRRPPFSRKP